MIHFFNRNDSVTADFAWRTLLSRLITNNTYNFLSEGHYYWEVPNPSFSMDMRFPVVTNTLADISCKQLVGEVLFCLSGSNRLKDLAPFRPGAVFLSEDGRTISNAYGPMLIRQLRYVIEELEEAPSSTKAGLTLWEPNPRPSHHMPEAIGMFFFRREGTLHAHVTMREVDAFRRLPYELFVFTAISAYIASVMNSDGMSLTLGNLYVNINSAFVQARDSDTTKRCLKEGKDRTYTNFHRKLYESHGAFASLLNDFTSIAQGHPPNIWSPQPKNEIVNAKEN